MLRPAAHPPVGGQLTPPAVIVYWRPGCIFCQRLRFVLRWHRLRPSSMVNIWRDAEAAAFVRSVAGGNETVPTVVIDGQVLVNPPPKVVVEALRRG
ncbi:MAG: glutaredoxin domain-containing protein [Acidimicrobiales bacterium]